MRSSATTSQTVLSTDADLDGALAHLEADGLVAFPTETTWGLAASARRHRAMERLRGFKGRGANQPISVLISSPAVLETLGCEVEPKARAWVEACWPGPLTLVLPFRGDEAEFAAGILSESGGLGVRCSPHPVAGALVLAAEARGLGPLTATSCNASGESAARTRAEARAVCGSGEDAPLVLASGADAGGETPSTVVEALGEVHVLREGAISKQRLREIVELSGIERAPGESL